MASGALDANGVYQYGESDSVSPFSTFMNKLAGSTSTQVGSLKAATARTARTTPPAASGFQAYSVVAGSAFPLPAYSLAGGLVLLESGWLNRSAGNLAVTAGTAYTLFTLPAGYRPDRTISAGTLVNLNGTTAAAQVRVDSSGVVSFVSSAAGTLGTTTASYVAVPTVQFAQVN